MIWRSPLIHVSVAFIASRLLFFLCGVRFDDSVFAWGWQLIDRDLLKHDLIESIFYLHSQPPLFNLYLGIVLKLFPNNFGPVLHLSFITMGMIQAVSMCLVMQMLNIPQKISLTLTIIFIFSPFNILYENWLFYTYPTMTCLSLSALALYQFLSTNKALYALAFNTLLCIIVLTRSMFHITWFVVILLSLLGLKKFRRKMILTAFIPFLMALGWFAKNYVLFNTFSTSSWFGMNISNLTVVQLKDSDRKELISNGILSPISAMPTFRRVSQYMPFIKESTGRYDDIDVLARELKSDGSTNMNNIHYLEISEQYKRDALVIIKNRPLIYLRSVLCALRVYFMPPSQYVFLDKNRNSIAIYSRVYEALFLGSFAENSNTQESGSILQKLLVECWVVILLYIAIFHYWIKYAWKMFRFRSKIEPAGGVVLLFMLFNIIYVGIIGNLFDMGENMRFHMLVYPFLVVMLGLKITPRSRSPEFL